MWGSRAIACCGARRIVAVGAPAPCDNAAPVLLRVGAPAIELYDCPSQERQMPSTRIVTGAWARGSEGKILEAVQSALLGALKLPEHDRDIVLDIYDETTRIVMLHAELLLTWRVCG
jgi:hypothetical protein